MPNAVPNPSLQNYGLHSDPAKCNVINTALQFIVMCCWKCGLIRNEVSLKEIDEKKDIEKKQQS